MGILRVEIAREDDGRFTIRNPQTAVSTFGDTLEEAFAEAIQLFTEALAEHESSLGRRQKKSLALLRKFADVG